MNDLEKKLVEYANFQINVACEWEGTNSVIQDLVEFGFTKDELGEMGFDADAIDTALGNNKEER